MENVCERLKEQINCVEIHDKLPTFKGAHEFFRFANTDACFVGIVQKAMRLGHLYIDSAFK